MIARVQTVIANAMPVAALASELRDEFSRVIRLAPGYTGGLLLVDGGAATVIVVSLWENSTTAIPELPIPATATVRDDASGIYTVAFSSRTLGGVMARITSVRLTPDQESIDRGIRLHMNSAMVNATTQGGFRRGLLLVDRSSHRAITIGLWDSLAAIEAGEASGYSQSQLALYAEFIAAPPLRLIAGVILEE